ncbi:copper homeostasis protein CutC [Allofustis seminis]|uniref:copper homeostasis protein CutC n=1 Tax=Allofustis seminis TaxID=166939 RepID=UPI0003685DCE|nr:copper homeostasis protein CutC [Allofustis seminis]
MIKEFCAENFTEIEEAIKHGARRIELCDNLAVGGTTPSVGVIQYTLAVAAKYHVPVMVMVRPRGGDFVYTAEEFDIMKRDLKEISDLNADGAVFGCLTEDGRINRLQTAELIKRSGEMETVFHMAFDEIHPDDRLKDLKWLIDQGVTRVLTHGGIGGSIFDHEKELHEILKYAQGRIEILLGGGVTYENEAEILKIFDVDQLHGTRIVPLDK